MLYRLFFGLIIFSSLFGLVYADSPELDSIIINNLVTVNSGSTVEDSKIEVFADEIVHLTGIYFNCDIGNSPVIKWYKNNFVSTDEVGEGFSINIQTLNSGNYFATLYCKGIQFNSINFVIEIKDPTVDVGLNSSLKIGTNVNLTGSIVGAHSSCTTFDYQWEQVSGPVVEITNSGQMFFNSNTYNSASFVFPDTTENIVLKLNVTPQSCYHSLTTYSGSVTYSKKTGGGGRSFYSRMLDEANSLFFDTGSIDNIKLILNLSKDNYSPFLYLGWNNIGGNGHINYVLQYSTGSTFQTISQIETKEIFYNYEEKLFDYDYLIHYFRLKACYYNKCSDYSNVVKYYTEDYLNITCNDIKLPKYEDVIDNYELFLDDYYSVKCIKCGVNKKKTTENDENKLLDLYYKYSCNKCKNIEFKDINSSFIDEFYKTNCVKCSKINY